MMQLQPAIFNHYNLQKGIPTYTRLRLDRGSEITNKHIDQLFKGVDYMIDICEKRLEYLLTERKNEYIYYKTTYNTLKSKWRFKWIFSLFFFDENMYEKIEVLYSYLETFINNVWPDMDLTKDVPLPLDIDTNHNQKRSCWFC